MFEELIPKILSDLKQLGLKELEAKALLALIQADGAISATKLSNLSKVPRTKTYEVLEELIRLNLVEIIELTGSANKYRLLFEPKHTISVIRKNKADPIEQAARRLEGSIDKVAGVLKDEDDITSEIRLIKGRAHVLRTLKQSTRDAKSQILSNMVPAFVSPIINELKDAKRRGVNVTLSLTDQEVEKIEERISIGEITSVLIGADISKIRDFLPEDIQNSLLGGFKKILTEFDSFLNERPNIFIVDPESDEKNLFLVLKSIYGPENILAVQTTNFELINSFTAIMRIIVGLATNLKALQTKLVQEKTTD